MRGRRAAAFLAVLLLGAACSGSSTGGVEAAQRRVDQAKRAVSDANGALEQAGATFCAESKDYILAIDRYGQLFDQEAATIGDFQTLGADLAEPRETTVAAAQAVLDAHDTVNEANQDLAEARAELKEAKASASGTPTAVEPSPTPSPSAPTVPSATIDRVRDAESDLEAAARGITDRTPIVEAAERFHAAAFALEAAWLNLFADAGCLTDEQSQQAVESMRAYTLALQTDLTTAGYLTGEVDGVYGPETVSAVEDLQADAGLPVTGLVDLSTRDALDAAVAQAGSSTASQEQIQASSVQTVLKLAGYWPGAVDGEWTPELEEALKDFQRDLGVKPSGTVDAATLAALDGLLVELTAPEPTEAPSPTTSPSAG